MAVRLDLPSIFAGVNTLSNLRMQRIALEQQQAKQAEAQRQAEQAALMRQQWQSAIQSGNIQLAASIDPEATKKAVEGIGGGVEQATGMQERTGGSLASLSPIIGQALADGDFAKAQRGVQMLRAKGDTINQDAVNEIEARVNAAAGTDDPAIRSRQAQAVGQIGQIAGAEYGAADKARLANVGEIERQVRQGLLTRAEGNTKIRQAIEKSVAQPGPLVVVGGDGGKFSEQEKRGLRSEFREADNMLREIDAFSEIANPETFRLATQGKEFLNKWVSKFGGPAVFQQEVSKGRSFKSSFGAFLQDWIKSKSGATVTEQERTLYNKIIGDPESMSYEEWRDAQAGIRAATNRTRGRAARSLLDEGVSEEALRAAAGGGVAYDYESAASAVDAVLKGQ